MRPAGVPGAAEWNAAEAEWELGAKRDGHPIGAWTWWRGDGTRVCESLFDDDGNLHGECRRFHPGGELAYQAVFDRGDKRGREIVCRPLTGDTPEVGAAQLAELDPELYRMEMFWADGAIQAMTMYNRDGLVAPIAAGEPVGDHLHKLRAGTSFHLRTPFLITMGSVPQPPAPTMLPPKIPRSMVTRAGYICLAVVGGTIHRVEITDHHGHKHIAIVEAFDISKSLELGVEFMERGGDA